MNALINIVGLKYGRLTVRSKSFSRNRQTHWECVCECGNVVTVSGNDIKRGTTKSCGCLRREINTTHGERYSAIYQRWAKMKERCLNKNCESYHNYGGRGITVCERWKEFRLFHEDMGDIPFDGAELDRSDNNKGYSPENCRWVTKKVNANNKRNNVILSLDGESKTISEWSDKTGLGMVLIRKRIKRGWSVKDALSVKPQKGPWR